MTRNARNLGIVCSEELYHSANELCTGTFLRSSWFADMDYGADHLRGLWNLKTDSEKMCRLLISRRF